MVEIKTHTSIDTQTMSNKHMLRHLKRYSLPTPTFGTHLVLIVFSLAIVPPSPPDPLLTRILALTRILFRRDLIIGTMEVICVRNNFWGSWSKHHFMRFCDIRLIRAWTNSLLEWRNVSVITSYIIIRSTVFQQIVRINNKENIIVLHYCHFGRENHRWFSVS